MFFLFVSFTRLTETSAKACRIEQQSAVSIYKSAGGRSGIYFETDMPLAVRLTAANTLAHVMRVLTHTCAHSRG